MAKYRLEIQLLSDLCISDGGVYNSMVDTDCCHNEIGFPFIPAKRIKGCLRECALELNDWGKNIPVRELFGEGERPEEGTGVKRAAVRISDAYLQDYSSMVEEVAAHQNHLLYHPQHILNRFTSLRTQTAISLTTGVADPHSLRTIRVINKGLTFLAEVEMPSVYYSHLADCCAVLTGMGIARTRGFGEVLVSIIPESDSVDVENADGKMSGSPIYDAGKNASHAVLVPGADYLTYEITLEEPVICKSVAGGEARTLDYIEGSKVLGFILDRIKTQENGRDKALRFLDEKALRCTNAYIGCGGKRYTEVPAYIYSIKNNKVDYVDRRVHRENPEGIQLSQMKHCYVRMDKETLYTLDVDVEERYHHKRSEDKSIGRAVSTEENSGFYQMASIMAGQKFYGRLYGTAVQVGIAYECLVGNEMGYIGYSRSAEYGKVRIRIVDSGRSDAMTMLSQISSSEFVIKLEAPTIIYNDKAMYSVDWKDLLAEVISALKVDKSNVLKSEVYMNFTTVGGFNVTWGRRKPTVSAFDKGTAIFLKLDREVAVSTTLFLGERSLEGYGEASVSCGTQGLHNDRGTGSGSQANPVQERLGKTVTNLFEGVPTCPDPSSMEYSDYLKEAVLLVRSGSVVSVVPGHPADSKYQEGDGEVLRKGPTAITIVPGSLGDQLADSLFTMYLGARAREQAQQYFQAIRQKIEVSAKGKSSEEIERAVRDRLEKFRPTISNMLVGFDDYQTIAEVEKMVAHRYGKRSSKKEEKLSYAENILDSARKGFTTAQEQFCTEHCIERWEWIHGENPAADSAEGLPETSIINDHYQLIYLQELLLAMKLGIRGIKDIKARE